MWGLPFNFLLKILAEKAVGGSKNGSFSARGCILFGFSTETSRGFQLIDLCCKSAGVLFGGGGILGGGVTSGLSQCSEAILRPPPQNPQTPCPHPPDSRCVANVRCDSILLAGHHSHHALLRDLRQAQLARGGPHIFQQFKSMEPTPECQKVGDLCNCARRHESVQKEFFFAYNK